MNWRMKLANMIAGPRRIPEEDWEAMVARLQNEVEYAYRRASIYSIRLDRIIAEGEKGKNPNATVKRLVLIAKGMKG